MPSRNTRLTRSNENDRSSTKRPTPQDRSLQDHSGLQSLQRLATLPQKLMRLVNIEALQRAFGNQRVQNMLVARQAAAPAPKQPLKPKLPQADQEKLGALSEKYESGGRGPGVVSGGVGDAGGPSYGTYQFPARQPIAKAK